MTFWGDEFALVDFGSVCKLLGLLSETEKKAKGRLI